MKHLKIYEGFIKTNKKLGDSKLKIKDYVRIKTSGLYSEDIYQIQQVYEYDEEPKDSETRFTYLVTSNTAPDHWKYAYELELVPEIEIASIKYNL